MSLRIIEQDITTMKVDAIVNSTNRLMIGYSGVDRLLHKIGGPEFEEECRALSGKCFPGEAVYTNAYNLDCRYIIHTMAPNWEGGICGEAAILRGAYRSSLKLAQELNCKSVAFPLLSAGNRAYPVVEALRQAVTAIYEFLQIYDEMQVYVVVYGSAAAALGAVVDGNLNKYVDEQYKAAGAVIGAAPGTDLDSLLEKPGEDFVTMMYRFFDERGIVNDAAVYNNAFISRAAFNKIKNGGTKNPSLKTVIALAMALELPYKDAVAWMASAGLALSSSSRFDIIAAYHLQNGLYDISALDVHLFQNGCPTIASCE